MVSKKPQSEEMDYGDQASHKTDAIPFQYIIRLLSMCHINQGDLIH